MATTKSRKATATAVVTPPPAMTPWQLYLAVSAYVKRMLLHSTTPGTGKTTAGISLADAKGADCICITVTDTMTVTDLLGMWMPSRNGGHHEWFDGMLTRAIRRATEKTVVVINELNHAGADVLQILYALLETDRAAQFTLPSNEVLTIPKGLTVVATMNPDPRECLPEALVNRFQVIIDIGEQVSPMILEALPDPFKSMVADGRMAAREAFALQDLVKEGCDPYAAIQATLGADRAETYGDALAIALAS